MGGKTGTTTQSVQIPPQVLARYNAVNAQAQSVASTPFRQYSTNPNDFVAPLNEQQYAGIGGINQAANMAQPSIAYAQQGFTGPGYQKGVQEYMNPYLQNAMGSTAAQMQNVNQQQQNQLAGNAIQQGAFGGDRAGIARNNLINQQNLAMGQTLGQMANQGYQQSAQNYMTGLGQIGQLGLQGQQAALQGAQAQLGAGTLQQQTQQAGQTALYNQFLQQQAYPFQVAQFLANIAMGTGGLSGSNTTTTQPMPFFSDRRLKKNVERIGQTDEGLPIHKFEYKGDPKGQKHIGLMADEVEQIHPEAVGTHKSGYKVVDYDRATSEGGAVTPQRAGLGFADGGDVAASLKAMNEMQANMPVQGGGINEGLAEAARAIAPTPNVPQSVYERPSYNPFADPKYQPDFAGGGLGLGAGSGSGRGFGNRGDRDDRPRNNYDNTRSDRVNTNPFNDSSYSADSNGMMYGRDMGFMDGYDPTQGSAFASGGRAGYQTAGAVMGGYNPAFDPYNIENIINRHMAMYAKNEGGHHVPVGRSLAGGMGKYGRLPEANLPVRSSLMLPSSPAPLPDSGFKQGMSAVSDFSKTKEDSEKIINWLTSLRSKAAGESQDLEETKTTEQKAFGGPVGYATNGTVQAPDPTDEIYGQEDTDATKRNIPTKFDRTKLQDPAKPPTPTSQTGLGIGDVLSIGSKFVLPFLPFNQGGRAGYENGGDIEAIKRSIASIESGGQKNPYLAIGPETRKGNRAYGKYQVMDFNIPTWTEQAIGRSLTPQEFLNDQKAQEDVASHFMGQYYRKYGTPDDVASVWFTGKPVAKAGLVSDATPTTKGTTNIEYLNKFRKGLGNADIENVQASLPSSNATPSGGLVAQEGGSEEERRAPTGRGQSGFISPETQSWLLPLLSGLGTMASSNSPYLGAAVLQGLGGAAQAYQPTQQAIKNLEATQAGIESTDVGTAGSRVIMRGNQLIVIDQNNQPISGWDWLEKPFPLNPNDRAKIEDWARSQGIKIPKGTGAAGDSATTPQSPEIMVGELPEIGSGKTPEPMKPYGQQEPQEVEIGEGLKDVTLSPEAMRLAEENKKLANMQAGKVPDYFTPQAALGDASRTQRGTLLPLAGAFSRIPASGPAAGGTAQAILKPLQDTMISLMTALNAPDYIKEKIKDPEVLANQSEVKKLVGMLSAQGATAAGQHAYAALQELANTVPSDLLDKRSQAKLMAQLLMVNQREIDKANYFNQFYRRVGGPNAMYSGVGLSEQFEKDYNRNFYANEAKNIEKMFMAKFPKNHPYAGRSIIDVMTSGEKINRADLDKIKNEFGDDYRIFRYFGVNI